ncbi:TIGR01777 family oxidoreductase [Pasteurella bettyae]|uniref:TIGR01777 family oxidoreductase n=1 Tax=Pasteurella bettyae TaxID=752 RepID=UPI003D2DAC3D
MNILITGATGLVGTALIPQLLAQHHHITALTRSIKKAKQKCSFAIDWIEQLENFTNLDQFDVVINLAGEPIFNHPWTNAQKVRLKNSRILLTQQLSTLINQGNHPPLFISGSATGYYGDGQQKILTENSPPGNSFTSELCQAWEQSALNANTRVCIIRTGMIMAPKGGALAKMLPIYRLGLGGKLGSGQQYWPWIALEDMVNGINFLLNHKTASGIFNFTAPNPVHNSEFNQILANTLKRFHFAMVPAFLLKFLFGERVQLLLDSQNVYPTHLLKLGYQFKFETLADYFQKKFQK